MDVNYLDIIIAVPLLWGMYKGFTKGFVFEVSSVLALSLGIWAGSKFADYCAQHISDYFDWHSPYLPILSFAIVFIAIVISIHLCAKLLQRLVKGLSLGGIDKLLGAVVGSLKFALLLSVLMFIIKAVENSYTLVSFEAKTKSVLYEPVSKIAPLLIPALNAKASEQKINEVE